VFAFVCVSRMRWEGTDECCDMDLENGTWARRVCMLVEAGGKSGVCSLFLGGYVLDDMREWIEG